MSWNGDLKYYKQEEGGGRRLFLQRYPIYSITCSSPWHRLAGNAETKQKRFFFFLSPPANIRDPGFGLLWEKRGMEHSLPSTDVTKFGFWQSVCVSCCCCVWHKQKILHWVYFTEVASLLHFRCLYSRHELLICFFQRAIFELMVSQIQNPYYNLPTCYFQDGNNRCRKICSSMFRIQCISGPDEPDAPDVS